MSAFRVLLEQADKLGVAKLVFACDVRGYREDDQMKRWTCTASGNGLAPAQGLGRSGEEALREIVGFLERIK